MSRRLTLGTMAAVALLVGAPGAKADEVSDLRANNELLQQRLDQIAQSGGAIPGAAGLYPGAGINPAGNAGATAGSFPRSFLIPGTDTSLRVGGQITEIMDYWFEGGNPNASPQSTTVGDNGQVQSIPLGGTASARSSNIFLSSPRESKISFETRTPTPYGEARTYMEWDWAGSTAYSPGGNGPLSVSDNLAPRLRFAYGTLGGWLVGQANSNFSDADGNAETLDFGGNVGDPGVVRIPQIRYTQPLTWGWGGAVSFSAETPETDIDTPNGQISSDCGVGCAGVATGPGVAATQPNPTKATAPDLTAALYIPQPWGHVDFSLVLRPGLELSDGAFLSRSYLGYGGHFGMSLKPGWFHPKDTFNFNFTAGDGIGRYLNSSTNFSIATNFTATTTGATTGLHPASAVLARTTTEYGFEVGYQHWWMDNLRSNISFGLNHHDIPSSIIGVAQSAAANHQLETIHANIIWNPVSFVDVGLEYMWGNRQVVAVAAGPRDKDEQALISKVAVRF